MELNSNLNENVDALFTNLGTFTQNEGLLGKPVTFGEKTLIPVVSLTLGYGSGDKAAKSNQGNSSQGQGMGMTAGLGNMSGGAHGLGAKVCTDAVLIIDNDKVSMIPIKAGAASGLMDKIPQMLGMQNAQTGQQSQQGQQGQQGQQQGSQQ